MRKLENRVVSRVAEGSPEARMGTLESRHAVPTETAPIDQIDPVGQLLKLCFGEISYFFCVGLQAISLHSVVPKDKIDFGVRRTKLVLDMVN